MTLSLYSVTLAQKHALLQFELFLSLQRTYLLLYRFQSFNE
jgi:hypothetical protein